MSTRRSALLGGALVAGVLVTAARCGLLVVQVSGTSMRPTYEPGDTLLAVRRRFSRRIRLGDVVVVRAPSARWQADDPLDAAGVIVVKRVCAPPTAGADVPLLGPGDAWVQGDAPGSYDSMRFGAVPRHSVIARVLVRIRRGAGVATADLGGA